MSILYCVLKTSIILFEPLIDRKTLTIKLFYLLFLLT